MNRAPECNRCECGSHAWAPATQHGVVIVDTADDWLLEEFAWHLVCPRRATPYAGSGKAKRRLGANYLHVAVFGRKPDCDVDHRNGSGLDCRRENLRHCSHRQNIHNRRAARSSTSRFIGVSWQTRSQKWVAQILVDGKNRYLGGFKSETEAAAAYDAAARAFRGEFARPNLQACTV